MLFQINFVSYSDSNLKHILDLILCFALRFYILSKKKIISYSLRERNLRHEVS